MRGSAVKISAFLVSFLMLFASFSVKATSENLIANGSFEQGLSGYILTDLHNYTLTDACAAEGEYSLRITNRTSNTESVRCDLTRILETPGVYSFSVKLRLDATHFEFSNMRGVITVITDTGTFNAETDYAEVQNGGFVCTSATRAINWTGKIEQAYFSVENKKDSEMCDFYVDDFRLEYAGKTEDSIGASEKLLVGALRCDCAYSEAKLVRGTMKRALPFYYDFVSESIPNFESTIEKDVLYARYAGIDYFAYRPEDGTYKLHPAGKINMCFVIGESTEITHIYALNAYFKYKNYQKYNGRELVIFSSDKKFAEKAKAIKSLCPSAIIIMLSHGSASFGQSELTALGSDIGKDFQEISAKDKSLWSSKNAILINAGALNPPTRNEAFKHISNGIEKAKSGMNTVILASWNDCNNGSCILPTYKVNARGEFERDGEKMLLDTDIIDALHSTLDGENIEIDRTASGKQTATPGASETGTPGITPYCSDGQTDAELPDSTGVEPESSALPTNKISQTARTTDKAPEPTATVKSQSKTATRKIVIAGISTFILLAGTVIYAVWVRKRKKSEE